MESVSGYVNKLNNVANKAAEDTINEKLEIVKKPSWFFFRRRAMWKRCKENEIGSLRSFISSNLKEADKNYDFTIRILATYKKHLEKKQAEQTPEQAELTGKQVAEITRIENAVQNLIVHRDWKEFIKQDGESPDPTRYLATFDREVADIAKNPLAENLLSRIAQNQAQRKAENTTGKELAFEIDPTQNAAFQLGCNALKSGKVLDALQIWEKANLSSTCAIKAIEAISQSISHHHQLWTGDKYSQIQKNIKTLLASYKGFGPSEVEDVTAKLYSVSKDKGLIHWPEYLNRRFHLLNGELQKAIADQTKEIAEDLFKMKQARKEGVLEANQGVKDRLQLLQECCKWQTAHFEANADFVVDSTQNAAFQLCKYLLQEKDGLSDLKKYFDQVPDPLEIIEDLVRYADDPNHPENKWRLSEHLNDVMSILREAPQSISENLKEKIRNLKQFLQQPQTEEIKFLITIALNQPTALETKMDRIVALARENNPHAHLLLEICAKNQKTSEEDLDIESNATYQLGYLALLKGNIPEAIKNWKKINLSDLGKITLIQTISNFIEDVKPGDAKDFLLIHKNALINFTKSLEDEEGEKLVEKLEELKIDWKDYILNDAYPFKKEILTMLDEKLKEIANSPEAVTDEKVMLLLEQCLLNQQARRLIDLNPSFNQPSLDANVQIMKVYLRQSNPSYEALNQRIRDIPVLNLDLLKKEFAPDKINKRYTYMLCDMFINALIERKSKDAAEEADKISDWRQELLNEDSLSENDSI